MSATNQLTLDSFLKFVGKEPTEAFYMLATRAFSAWEEESVTGEDVCQFAHALFAFTLATVLSNIDDREVERSPHESIH